MERQKRKGQKAGLLVELLLVGAIVGTAIVGCTAPLRDDSPTETTEQTETTAATVQTEPAATVPPETQPETTATEAPAALYDAPLSEELQLHIIQTSEAYGIDPAVVIAVIWKESTYRADAVGDGGNSLGLMQIQPRWHGARMDRLDCPDLLDPFQNVTVGIDILAGHLDSYDGNISMALMAYNAGAGGANSYWFSQGIYSNDYSAAVLNKAAQLEN